MTPSPKAICFSFKFKSLLEFSEQDIYELIGDINTFNVNPETDIDRHTIELNSSETITNFSEKKETDDLVNHQEAIINKYAGLIFTSKDMETLDVNERAKIKKYFKSDFYFLNLVRSAGN